MVRCLDGTLLDLCRTVGRGYLGFSCVEFVILGSSLAAPGSNGQQLVGPARHVPVIGFSDCIDSPAIRPGQQLLVMTVKCFAVTGQFPVDRCLNQRSS